jgi:ABC-type branched-subunit amino acid transport system ATPase component
MRNPAPEPEAAGTDAKAQAASGNPPALDLHAIEKSWGQHQVLKGIDLKVENGEVISIIGPSGSGKTTLIRTINALESIDGGEIILYGEDYLKGASVVDKQQMRAGVRRIGMVFQSFNLFPHRTVLDNVMLAPITSCLSSGSPESRPCGCWIASACWPTPKNTPTALRRPAAARGHRPRWR